MISKKYRKRFENVQKRWGVIYRAVIQKAQKYAGPVLSRFNQFWHRVSPKLTVKWVVLFGIVLMALITFFFDSMIYEPSRNQIIALNKQITSLNAQKLTINKELIDQSKLFTKVVLKAKDVNKSKELFKSLSRTDVINLCMEKLNDYNMELVYLKTNMMQNYGGTQLKKMTIELVLAGGYFSLLQYLDNLNQQTIWINHQDVTLTKISDEMPLTFTSVMDIYFF
ncbi:MAG: hypothetical protein HRT90_11960 [Candidatus Margulisbacteria bacterium]|nr:hypothetical protein [Candidatus Margulisiibacteriota bacterium]